MKLHTSRMTPVLFFATITMLCGVGQAQSLPGSPYAQGNPGAPSPGGLWQNHPAAARPAGFAGPPPGPGPGMAMPAGGAIGGPMPTGGFCPNCGGAGCAYCQGAERLNGDLNVQRLLGLLLPYAEGGICSPRWFDVHIEQTYLTREDVSRTVNFSSDGPAGVLPPVVILDSDDLSFGDEWGFRIMTAIQLAPGLSLDGGYMGANNWSTQASVTDPNSLIYSAFSQFGTNPPPSSGPPATLGGFQETDGAFFHQILYSSTFDSAELNLRRRWIAPNCRIQGSTIHGVRYFQLEEDFRHRTFVDNTIPANQPPLDIWRGNLDYNVGTMNSMVGYQLGGDLWMSIIPGLRVGGEFKAGVFYNRVNQQTRITGNDVNGPSVFVFESFYDDAVALVSQADMAITWRLNPNFTIRGGYQLIYADGVALAIENFNPQPPSIAGVRTPFLNHNGDLFLHGFTLGMEWMW